MDTSIARRLDGKLIQAARGIDKSLPFFCPGCKQEVYAATEGKIQRPHFRHKSLHGSKGCSEPESYIHWITKELFADHFKKIESFLIDIPYYLTCNASGSCKKKEVLSFDLKKRFPYIKVEEYDQGYKPDCILYNDAGEKLYLEVYYTHKTSDDKIALGLPIVEIEVHSEKDINKIIDNQKIDQKTIKYRIYNNSSLLPASTTFDCKGRCQRKPTISHTHTIPQYQKQKSYYGSSSKEKTYWGQIFSEFASWSNSIKNKQTHSSISDSISKINQMIKGKQIDSVKDEKEHISEEQSPKQMTFDFGD